MSNTFNKVINALGHHADGAWNPDCLNQSPRDADAQHVIRVGDLRNISLLLAPALITGLAPSALAMVMFRRHRILLALIPTLTIWTVILIFHLSGYWPILRQPGVPAPFNFYVALIAGLVTIVYVTHLFAMQADRAMAITVNSLNAMRLAQHRLDQQEIAKREREKFMGQLSHEIRTPVAALRNAVQLMRHPKASESMKERSIHLIDTTSENLLLFLNDALDSLKYCSGSFTVSQSEFDLPTLLDEVQSLFAAPAKAKGLALWIDLSTARHSMVKGDSMRLRQMLSNLLSNAIKFTEAGEVCIRVIERVGGVEDLWRFEVTDTGCGISPEDQDRLFKPFVQADSANRTTAAGTGLGLSIVQELAQAMGGRAGLSSVPNQGSTFWF